MGWAINSEKKTSQVETRVWFSESDGKAEKKSGAYFYDGELKKVVIGEITVSYPDGVHPLMVSDKDGNPLPEAKAKKIINEANSFVKRIENNSKVFHQKYPDWFGKDMVDKATDRIATRINDIELEMAEREAQMKVALAEKSARQKVARISPGMATICGEADDYIATAEADENRISKAYGVAPNAKKPDGKLTDADLKKLYEAEKQRLENLDAAKARVLPHAPVTKGGGYKTR